MVFTDGAPLQVVLRKLPLVSPSPHDRRGWVWLAHPQADLKPQFRL